MLSVRGQCWNDSKLGICSNDDEEEEEEEIAEEHRKRMGNDWNKTEKVATWCCIKPSVRSLSSIRSMSTGLTSSLLRIS